MSASRDKVLGRVRRALGRGELDEQTREHLGQRLANPQANTRIDFSEDSVERFVAKAESQAATVQRVASEGDIPQAVVEYLQAHNLAAEIAAAPALDAIEWPPHLTVEYGPTRGGHASAVTPCQAAVAETGSVVLLSGEASPTSLNLLPDNHLIIVKRSQIMRDFEAVWQQLRARDERLPRAVNLVTGPSRTADIEQTIQLGAHGPRRVHIILVDD